MIFADLGAIMAMVALVVSLKGHPIIAEQRILQNLSRRLSPVVTVATSPVYAAGRPTVSTAVVANTT